PYLFIHGRKMELPKARVTFMKGQQTTGSALINALLSASDSQPPAQENPVYSLLKSLPRSCQRLYPDRPPWTGEDFQLRFDQQTEAERLLDGSPVLLPCHQRRALHVLLAKTYRGDREIYSFIKAKITGYYPDQPADNRTDRSALEHWLARHPAPELRDIKADFWALARHCPATVHQNITGPDDVNNNSVKELATYVVAATPPAQQRPMAQRLGVDLRLARQKCLFDGSLRSTLKDILIAHRRSLRQDTIISQTVGMLESQISLILDQTDQQKSQQIRAILATAFMNDQLPGQCQDLPDVLLARQRPDQSRQERRLEHLAQRVREHPVVFLQGEAGAGKTFMARAIAARAGYPDCQVLQLGPNDTQEALFGGPQLVSYSMGNGAEDHRTEFREGPLLQWALSKDPPLLVLDEANLAPEGLLAPLAGLTRQPPVLHYQGREYTLPEQQRHRIILTGNPDHYSGRHLDNTLKSRIPTFFYNPLPDTVLANAIILPNLPQVWPEHLKHQARDRLLTLYSQFRALLEQTTPRD
ncbi:AAA family ATPase, partial [Endozoicomonas sp. ONNA2]|uniref:AAA family ATPase n=1 Tax=Endozoicomonas sp. ONNA2 TaxID=2828741 RepID=UPI0021492C63